MAYTPIRTGYAVYNVLNHGAVGNGVFDCTTAFQGAINEAAAHALSAGPLIGQRARVIIPGGGNTYKLSYTTVGPTSHCLEMLSNVELVGIGSPRLVGDAHGQPHEGDGGSILSNYSPVSNIRIEGVCFDGGYRANEVQLGTAFPDETEDFMAIDLPQVTDFEIVGNWLTGIYGDSLRVGDNACARGRIQGNYVTVFNGQAINVINPSNVRVVDNLCYDNQAMALGRSESIVINGGSNVTVANNIVDKAGEIGLYGSNTTCTGNVSLPRPGALGGIVVGDGDDACVANTISGNIVDLAVYQADTMGHAGISDVLNGVATTITGNIIKLGDYARVAGGIQAGPSTSVTGNTVWSPGSPAGTVPDIEGGSTIVGNTLNASTVSVKGNGAQVGFNNCAGTVS